MINDLYIVKATRIEATEGVIAITVGGAHGVAVRPC
jgi:hypothetical protein